MLGCAGPAWLTKGGIVVPFYADRQLVALAEQLAVQHPEWSVYATQINGGNTKMADALSRAYAAIMILNGVGHNLATRVTGRYRDGFAGGVTGIGLIPIGLSMLYLLRKETLAAQ